MVWHLSNIYHINKQIRAQIYYNVSLKGLFKSLKAKGGIKKSQIKVNKCKVIYSLIFSSDIKSPSCVVLLGTLMT